MFGESNESKVFMRVKCKDFHGKSNQKRSGAFSMNELGPLSRAAAGLRRSDSAFEGSDSAQSAALAA